MPKIDVWIVVVALAMLLFGWRLYLRANRIHRLHLRLAQTYAALSAQLRERWLAVNALLAQQVLDPASALLLAAAVTEAANAQPHELEQAESELTAAIRTIITDPDQIGLLQQEPRTEQVLEDLQAACARVRYARRFHNEAIAAVRVLRASWLTRVFHLAGRAPIPVSLEFDDDIGQPPITDS